MVTVVVMLVSARLSCGRSRRKIRPSWAPTVRPLFISARQQTDTSQVNEVLKHHLMVFAAEQSRREGRVVDCVAFEDEMRAQYAGTVSAGSSA